MASVIIPVSYTITFVVCFDIVSCYLLRFCQQSAMFRVTSCSFLFSYNGVDILPRHCRRLRTQFLNSYIEEADIRLLTGRLKSAEVKVSSSNNWC